MKWKFTSELCFREVSFCIMIELWYASHAPWPLAFSCLSCNVVFNYHLRNKKVSISHHCNSNTRFNWQAIHLMVEWHMVPQGRNLFICVAQCALTQRLLIRSTSQSLICFLQWKVHSFSLPTLSYVSNCQMFFHFLNTRGVFLTNWKFICYHSWRKILGRIDFVHECGTVSQVLSLLFLMQEPFHVPKIARHCFFLFAEVIVQLTLMSVNLTKQSVNARIHIWLKTMMDFANQMVSINMFIKMFLFHFL